MDKKTTAKATASKVKATTKKTTRATKATAKKSPVKATKGTEKKIGRPKAIIEARQFEELCRMQCTQREICSVLGVTDKTLMKWCIETYGVPYSEAYNKYADFGKKNLRHIQYRMAEAGSERMAIWLGKQWLGQSDKQDIQIAEIEDTTRTEIEDFLNDGGTNQNPQ